MSERPRAERKGGGAAVLVVGLLVVLLPALYVLSSGPAGHALDFAQWSTVYAPLVWAAEKWTTASDALGWYTNAWGLYYYGGVI